MKILSNIKNAAIWAFGLGIFVFGVIFHRRGEQRDAAREERDSAQRSTKVVQKTRDKERDIAQAQAKVREKNAAARQKRNETPDDKRFTGRTTLNDRLRDDQD